jgi:hypothetical protein
MMIDHDKRNFMKLLSSGACAVTCFSLLADRDFWDEKVVDSNDRDELIRVYLDWAKNISINPQEYFAWKVGALDSRSIDVDSIIRNDFMSGNIYNFEGFMFSKVEASILANIGFVLMNSDS